MLLAFASFPVSNPLLLAKDSQSPAISHQFKLTPIVSYAFCQANHVHLISLFPSPSQSCHFPYGLDAACAEIIPIGITETNINNAKRSDNNLLLNLFILSSLVTVVGFLQPKNHCIILTVNNSIVYRAIGNDIQ